MPEINIPRGPITNMPWGAIDHDPGEGGQACRDAINDALDGIELGAYDLQIVEELAGCWDSPAVATVCSWLIRVRAAAQAAVPRLAVTVIYANTFAAGDRRPYRLLADVVDGGSTFQVEWMAEYWSCTCEVADCAHVAAVRPIAGQGGEG